MNKLSSNAFFVFTADAGARLLGFLSTVYLARVLGTESFGFLVVGLSVLSYGLWFADLGLVTLGIRETAKPVAARTLQFREMLWLKLVLAVSVFLLLQLIVWMTMSGTVRNVSSGYLLYLFSYAVLTEWYYHGKRRFYLVTLSKFLFGSVFLAGVYFFVQKPEDVEAVPLLYFGAGLGVAIVLLGFVERDDWKSSFSFRPDRYRNALREMGWIGFGGGFGQVVHLLPPLVIGYFWSVADAGLWGAAIKVVFLSLMLDRVFVALFFPAITEGWVTNRERILAKLSSVLRLMIWGGFSVSLVIAAFPSVILDFIFGSGYSPASVVLIFLSWFLVLTLVNSVFAYTLIGIGEERAYFMSMAKGGVLSVMLIVSLTWLDGLRGAAAAVLTGELLVAAFMYFEFRKHVSVQLITPFLSAGITAGGLWLASVLLGLDSLWQMPVLWTGFVAIAFVLRGIRPGDLNWLNKR